MHASFCPFTADSMQARDLVYLAGIAAAEGSQLIDQANRLPDTRIEHYWSASKCRLNRWGLALRGLVDRAQQDGPVDKDCEPLFEEIFTGEALTRVWAAVLTGHDRHRAADDVQAIAQSVLNGHVEARHRALRILAEGHVARAEARELNRLFRRTARWIDLLVAQVDHDYPEYDLARFAVDPRRCRDFSDDLRAQRFREGGKETWTLTLASLRASLGGSLGNHSPNADLNFLIGGSVIACLDTDALEGTELLPYLLPIRLHYATADCDAMVRQLIAIS